jgi:hypothetical protein
VDFRHQLVGIRGDDRKGSDPFTGRQVLPILPQPSNAERPAVFHGNGIGLLGLLALDRFPLEEAIDWEYATPPPIRLPEGRQVVNGLAFGVDRFAPALGILTPVRNEAPAQRIE